MNKNPCISGLILGTIGGDCIGNPYIFMKSQKLFEMAPQIGWNVSTVGQVSVILMAGIEANCLYGCDIDKRIRVYRRWLKKSRVEADMVTSECFGRKYLSSDILYHQSEQNMVGALCSGGVLVRQIPIVLLGVEWDTETLFHEVAQEVRLTHSDLEIILYAQLYALCLQCILKRMTRVEIWDRLFEYAEERTVYRTLLTSYYEKPVCDDRDYSHIRTSFQFALYHFWHDTPYVSGVRSAVLAGGATDVNAALTGALLGASQGIRAIPRVWREMMTEKQEYWKQISLAVSRSVRYPMFENPPIPDYRYLTNPVTKTRRVSNVIIRRKDTGETMCK